MIGVSGVRSSCETVAMKSCLACSTSRWAVTSRATTTANWPVPSASGTGDTASTTSRVRPSVVVSMTGMRTCSASCTSAMSWAPSSGSPFSVVALSASPSGMPRAAGLVASGHQGHARGSRTDRAAAVDEQDAVRGVLDDGVEAAALGRELLEQPGVLQRDRGLVGEGGEHAALATLDLDRTAEADDQHAEPAAHALQRRDGDRVQPEGPQLGGDVRRCGGDVDLVIPSGRARRRAGRDRHAQHAAVVLEDDLGDLAAEQLVGTPADGAEHGPGVDPLEAEGGGVQLAPGLALLLRPQVVVVGEVEQQEEERQQRHGGPVPVADGERAESRGAVAGEDEEAQPGPALPHAPICLLLRPARRRWPPQADPEPEDAAATIQATAIRTSRSARGRSGRRRPARSPTRATRAPVVNAAALKTTFSSGRPTASWRTSRVAAPARMNQSHPTREAPRISAASPQVKELPLCPIRISTSLMSPTSTAAMAAASSSRWGRGGATPDASGQRGSPSDAARGPRPRRAAWHGPSAPRGVAVDLWSPMHRLRHARTTLSRRPPREPGPSCRRTTVRRQGSEVQLSDVHCRRPRCRRSTSPRTRSRSPLVAVQLSRSTSRTRSRRTAASISPLITVGSCRRGRPRGREGRPGWPRGCPGRWPEGLDGAPPTLAQGARLSAISPAPSGGAHAAGAVGRRGSART